MGLTGVRSGRKRLPVTEADFIAAGLLDPASPNARDRLALLEWLAERGVTVEQMQGAAAGGWLSALAGMSTLRPGTRRTLREVAASLAMSTDEVDEYYHAFGMPPAGLDEPVLTDAEMEMFAGVRAGTALVGRREMHGFLHLISTAIAGISEAAVSHTIARTAGSSEFVEARESLRGVQTVPGLERILSLCLRLNMELAARRLRHAQVGAESEGFRFAVGFVDLVGFTTLSRQITPRELRDLVDRFEATAYDIAGSRDARIVKFIGDEVMFVSEKASAACELALELIEEFDGDPQVKPRAGLAYGNVLVRSGDYCGPVVNLAARLAELAVRGEVLATPEVAAASPEESLRFEPAGRRAVQGFEDPVSVLNVERRAG